MSRHPWVNPTHASDPPPIRLWNEPAATEHLPTDTSHAASRCTCPTHFCGGRDSADWLTCAGACPFCNPPKRRRSAVNTREGEHAQAD